MKKTLAIILSCMLIVGVVFAMAISSAADGTDAPAEVFATTVQVHMPDGADEDDKEDIVFLGRQPLYENAEAPTSITGYSTTDVNNTLTVGDGTIVLDPATGTVTVTNVTGIYGIRCYTGSMTLVVKGTNTFTAPSGNNVIVNFAATETTKSGDLTIKGDGTLNTSTKAYGIVCQHGRLTITDNVTVKATTTDASGANPDAIHVASTGKGLTVNGNAKVWATAPVQAIRIVATAEPSYLGGNAEIHATATANLVTVNAMSSKKYPTATFKEVFVQDNVKFYVEGFVAGIAQKGDGMIMTVEDDALIDVTVKDCVSWKTGIDALKYIQLGGTVNLNVATETSSSSAWATVGLASSGGKGLDLAGGKLNISVRTASGLTASRATAIFTVPATDDASAVNISGTDITMDVKIEGSCNTTSSGGFDLQTKATFTMTGGSITANIGEGVRGGLFNCRIGNNVWNISGGKISGTGDVLAHATSNTTIKVTGGEIDWTSRVQNLRPSSTSVSCATPAEGAFAIDAAAKTIKISPLAAPANLKVEGVTKDDVPVKWDAVANAAGYNVYVNGEFVETVTATSYTVPAMPNTKYDVVVETVNSFGGIGLSSQVSATTPDGVSSRVVPNAPTGLILNGANDTKAIISWNAVEGADGYNVYVDDVKVNEAVITDTVYALEALEAGKEVSVTVVAVNLVGDSEKATAIKVAPVVSDKASLLEVTLADGTLVALGSGKTSVNGATGSVSFDAATGIATVTDLTGVRSLISTKTLTVIFKGTSHIGTDSGENVLCADNLIFDGDGTVTVAANKASYPIKGEANVTLQGSVKMTINAPAASSIIHAARKGGDCTILVKDNVVLNAVGTGKVLHAAGERVAVIITDNVDLTLDGTSDTILAIADTDDAGFTGTARSYVEVSGNAKLLITKGNCGIRCSYAIQNVEFNGSSEVVFKDNALIDITAPGQTVYVVDAAGTTNKGTNTATFTLTGNAHAKLTNNGPASNGKYYAALHLNSDGNTLNINGGSLELIVGEKSTLGAYKVDGRPTYNFKGYKSFVGGDDAETATDITAFSSSPKYIKIVFTNPPTSDVSVSAVATAAALAVMMGLAVVVLRKKAHN